MVVGLLLGVSSARGGVGASSMANLDPAPDARRPDDFQL
jgi:hypothetical protein